MSADIELQLKSLPTVTAQNPEQIPLAETLPVEIPLPISGNENGSVFFNLDWQSQQAEDRRQALTTAFFGDGSLPESIQPEITRDENRYLQNIAETNWNDLVNLAKDHEDFDNFRRQPENFWRAVRQLSEPRRVEVTIDNETVTQTVSQYEELLTAMQENQLSPQSFAQTLPPNEQAVFLACCQLDETFGAPSPLQPAGENEPTAFPNADTPREYSSENQRAGEFTAAAENGEEITFGATETAFFGGNPTDLTTVRIEDKTFETTRDDASPNALGAANLILTDNAAGRFTGGSNSESANVSAVSRRESGVAMGGALISGALNSIEDYRQVENRAVGGSRAVGNFYDVNGGGFAAGATGAMMSAAIGSVIPGAGTDVSGVLGFVSGVVVGVEADQGIRWLGADGNHTNAVKGFDVAADDSNNRNTNLQFGFA